MNSFSLAKSMTQNTCQLLIENDFNGLWPDAKKRPVSRKVLRQLSIIPAADRPLTHGKSVGLSGTRTGPHGEAEPTAPRDHRRRLGAGKPTAQRHHRAHIGDERPRTRPSIPPRQAFLRPRLTRPQHCVQYANVRFRTDGPSAPCWRLAAPARQPAEAD